MYNKIDNLVNEIVKTDEFLNYIKANHELDRHDVFLLLSKHSMIQEDYLKSKKFRQYIDNEDLFCKYKEVKRELMNNQYIIDYYQSYYKINDLLQTITSLLFSDLSDEIVLDSISIGSKLWE